MQSDYMYMNDIIYTINEDIKVVFHTVASFTNNNTNKTYSNCTEFKINSNQNDTDDNNVKKKYELLSFYR